MGIQFVTPERVKLTLSDNDFIIVKKRLTHGERDAMMSRMLPAVTIAAGRPGSGDPLGGSQVQSKDVRAGAVAAYLLAWSHPEPIDPTDSDAVRQTLNQLDPDSFDEIERVIHAHIAAVEKEIAARKNGQAAALSEAISISVG